MTELAVSSGVLLAPSESASPSSASARATGIAALVCSSVGLLVLAAWALDPETTRGALGGIAMPPNTALAFLIAGASLWIQRQPRVSTLGRVVALALATSVLALGALSFAERAFDLRLGIGRLLFENRLASYPDLSSSGMATNSAVAFVLAGGALIVLDAPSRWWGRTAQWLATAGLLIASAAIVGYLYDVRALYQVDSAAAMAVSSAIAFFALHAGLLFSRSDASWPGVLLAKDAGGTMARRLLVAVCAVPLALGWLLIHLNKDALASREAGVALLVVALTAVLMMVVIRAATAVRVGEAAIQALLEREADARLQAERANNAKNDFLAVMSHELRTPLNAIIGYSSLMAEGIPDEPTKAQHRQLDRIHASAQHLLTLIEQVLTLSRMELQEQEQPSFSPVRVAELAEDSAAMVAPQAREKQIDLTVVIDDDALVIDTDEAKLRQALVNLMGNAVKFTDQGYVRLRVSRTADEDRVRFTVEDSGPGIPPEHIERIFEAFWQIDQSASRRAGGVGLGLHVTRGIVRSLGGDISVHSTPAQGSAFTIRLPVQH
ncbi:MAG TPA: HAMP domain-containing sensor histidine kinase [Gemmatimonadaceae bacterium]|nr:HAMP domain-containing sensor histidine kinase [Gemmatimonadaceae bacterium]